VRRRERRLARAHDLHYRLAGRSYLPPAGPRHALRPAHGPLGPEVDVRRTRAFHRKFATQALAQGWLRLWFLELDGRPRAAWYGFRFGGAESYCQAGRDPACADGAVGFVLLAYSIRAALDDGVPKYHLLRGGEAFKYRFAHADPGSIRSA
jgi:hypothetical protein